MEPEPQRHRKTSLDTTGNTWNQFLDFLCPRGAVVPLKAVARRLQLTQKKHLINYIRPFQFCRFGRLRAWEVYAFLR